ncbi:MAG: methylmalonyl-CoA mutase small subunit [Gemmatimonadaceae bacterium]|nr:methylmalonyl-CoA mutase small subunit [Gemmatimonadaceae bacterium]
MHASLASEAAESPAAEPLTADFDQFTIDAWRALAERSLKGRSLDTLVSRTDDGIAIAPLLTALDAPALAPSAARVPHGAWDVRQAHAHVDPARANAQLLEDLIGGATSIVLHADPTGARGTRVRSAADLDRALEGVFLEMAGVHLAPHGPWEALAETFRRWLVAHAPASYPVRGGLGADPLGALVSTGSLDTSMDDALQRLGALAVRTHEALPGVRAVRVSSLPYHGAWASEAIELASLVATGITYLRALVDSGLDLTSAAAQIEFELAADGDQFLTIAKVRAARRLWARVIEACDGDPIATPMSLAAVTAPRMYTRHDPYVNVLRATTAAFSAGVGGVDAITVLPHDTCLGYPGARARRIARNLHHVLIAEGQLRRVDDPAGGAWLYERLTEDLVQGAWLLVQEFERAGGMGAALVDGLVAARIAKVASARWTRICTRREALVGTSVFPMRDAPVLDTEPRANTASASTEALSLAPVASSSGGVTVAPFPAMRLAAPYEALRDASDAALTATGSRPRVALVAIGAVADHAARVGFARQLLAAGGIDDTTIAVPVGDGGTLDLEGLTQAFVNSETRVVCLCASDDDYAQHAASVARVVHAAGARGVWMAGRPGEHEAAWREAGVTGYVYLGCDVPAALRSMLTALGIAVEPVLPPFATAAV